MAENKPTAHMLGAGKGQSAQSYALQRLALPAHNGNPGLIRTLRALDRHYGTANNSLRSGQFHNRESNSHMFQGVYASLGTYS